ncbi:MAG: ABC transporter ATP-binding protein [Clostridia bacterium]|nr:ABC transporter ATP-binding protein [Clostridia bacterium]
MFKLLKYLKESKLAVLAIVVLLVGQAYCDLSLPTYTANIVNVGIQQGGIENVAPTKMRAATHDGLRAYLTPEQAELLEMAYRLDEEGNYVLIDRDKKVVENLNAMLAKPIVALSTVQSLNEKYGLEAPTGQEAAGGPEVGSGLSMLDQLDGQSDSILQQKAIQFVKEEYTALGMDLGDVQMSYLLSAGAQMLGLSLVMVACAVLVGLLAAKTSARVGMTLRGTVFKKVVSFSSAETGKFSTASLITRSTNDIQQIQMVMVMLLRIVIYAPILGIGGIFKVMTTDTGMSWIIGVAVGLVVLVVVTLMSLAMPRFKKMQQLVDRLNLVAREILTGIPVIRAFSREKHEEERFDVASTDLMRTQLFTNRVMTFMMPAMMFIMNGITVLIVWVGSHGVDMGAMQVGDIMAFITYTMQIVMSFLMISMISVMLPRAGVAAGRINEVIETVPTIHDKEKNKDDSRAEWRGEVSFDDVSFRYPDAGADVLEHISFTARPGETTAIIGSTGSGKSTLINLVPRFFDVSCGRITMDGVDIRDLSQHKLRSLMGYVPQKGILFSGDIESNLKFGGGDITQKAMEEAAEIAQAAEFIESKPDRYATPIAQGGTNVSGGQKQRLSIARAIAKHPSVLLFDDSFSALDYKTDVALRRALGEKVKDCTVIIVAQRVSTILHADQIVVLDEGKVAGIGTHEGLMKTCPTYQEIARSQLSEAELGGAGA